MKEESAEKVRHTEDIITIMAPSLRVQIKNLPSYRDECSNIMMLPYLIAQEPTKATAIIASRRNSGMTTFSAEDDDSIHSEDPGLVIDESVRSDTNSNHSRPPATVIGDRSCLAERYLKSCLADKTQRRRRKPATISPFAVVRFDKVEFREYPIILGDNPCTTSGPPIGLGWHYDPKDTLEFDVDSYETQRYLSGIRRTKQDLRMPPEVRIDMVLNAGHSFQEIQSATQRVKEDQERRIASLRYRRYDVILERAEKIKKGVIKRMPAKKAARRDSLQLLQ